MSLTEVIFWLIFIGGTCTALVHPVVGVLVYILVYHLNPEYQWWGENVRAAGVRTSMTVAAATVLGLLIRRPKFSPNAHQFPLPLILMIALAFYALTSLLTDANASERGYYQTEKFIKIAIFILILVRCVRTPAHFHLAICAWLAGVTYICYQAWGQVGVWRSGRLDWGLGGPDFAESSDLSAHLVATLPMIGAMFFMSRRWSGRVLCLLIGALAINTLIMTRTRNAIVGVLAMSLAAVSALPRGYRIKGLSALAVGAALAVQLTDPGWWHRMDTLARYRADPAVMARFQYWNAALEMAGDNLFGIGIGNFHERVKQYVPHLAVARSAHNTYLECLAELGVPGITLLLSLIGVTLWRLSRIRRTAARLQAIGGSCPPYGSVELHQGRFSARFHLGWHAMGLNVGLVGYLACGIFTTRLWAEDFWMLIGLACCLGNVTATMSASAMEQGFREQGFRDSGIEGLRDGNGSATLIPESLKPSIPLLQTLHPGPDAPATSPDAGGDTVLPAGVLDCRHKR